MRHPPARSPAPGHPSLKSQASLRLAEHLRRHGLGLTAAAIGLIALDHATGWQVSFARIDHEVHTSPLTLCVIGLALAALWQQKPGRNPGGVETALWIACLGLIALFPVSGDFAHWVSPDRALGPMRPNTAFALSAIVLSHLIYMRLPWLGMRLLLIGIVPPIVALNGIALGSGSFHGEMSLTTALATTGLWLASLRRYARVAPLRMFLRHNRAGRLLRAQIGVWLAVDLCVLLGLRVLGLQGTALYPAIHSGEMLLTWGLSFWFSIRFAGLLDEARQTNSVLLGEAERDHLTRLATRRATERHFAHVAQDNTPICAVLIDIDHFKQINDRLGHAVGDQALQWLSDVIRDNMRLTDFAARWGGEEFLVVLNRAPPMSAIVWAERLRSALRNTQRPPGIPAMTVSVGIAASSALMEQGLGELVNNADRALYAAKADGRDCTWFADPDLGLSLRRTSPRRAPVPLIA